jgi:hypothetical protein
MGGGINAPSRRWKRPTSSPFRSTIIVFTDGMQNQNPMGPGATGLEIRNDGPIRIPT